MHAIEIERDNDCDCPRWLRWRVVAWVDVGNTIRVPRVLAHTITHRGARRRKRRYERQLDLVIAELEGRLV